MAFERQWNAVPAVALTADGSTTGVIQVVDTIGFYVKMLAQLSDSSGATLTVEIKRVLSSTILLVGPPKTPITTFTDCSAFSVGLSSVISAAQQNKTSLSMEDRMLATYEQEPVNAWRTKSVDPYGDAYTESNPLPVAFQGAISIGSVEVKGTNGNFLEPNADGSLNEINLAQLVPFEFNEVDLTNSVISGQTVPVTVIYKQGGVTVATLTLTYDGSANLTSVVRT